MVADVAIYFDGGRMNFLHHLTIMSAVNCGHSVTVYVRGEAQNIPDMVSIEDAGKIVDLDRFKILSGSRLRSTVFQYEALAALEDTVTLSFDHYLHGGAQLELLNGALFGWQDANLVGTGVLALPKDSPALSLVINEVRGQPPAEAHLGSWGSELLTRALRETGEVQCAQEKSSFYMLEPYQVSLLLNRQKEAAKGLSGAIRAIPIYHEVLLPKMRSDFFGLPRYWSPLGAAIRESGVSVRTARAFEDLSPPDRVWNNEKPSFSCIDWQRSQSDFAARIPETAPANEPRLTDRNHTRVTSSGVTENDALKVMIVTTMRNEAPFILEWVAYHRSIGVTDFVVYTNDCDDGTVELLDALVDRGLITARIDNPFRTSAAGDWQRAALWDLQEGGLADDMDWLIPMDVDEYINIHVGEGHFSDLVRAVPDADMISMIWRLFGNNFIDTFEDRFITEQFDRAIHQDCTRPALAWGFKTAFNPKAVQGVWSVHRPKKIEDQKGVLNWYLGNGRKIDDKFFKAGWRVNRRSAGYDLVSLNHYAIRSSESYLVKKHRGRVNHTKEDQDIGYFFRMNHNVVQERSIQAKLSKAKAIFREMLEYDDLHKLHNAGVAYHRSRIKKLKDDPGYSLLFSKITSETLKLFSRLTPHFGNWIFSVGPQAIPEEYTAWAHDVFALQSDTPQARSHAPGLQPSGTILPKPECLDELNERRKVNLPDAKALDQRIFDDVL